MDKLEFYNDRYLQLSKGYFDIDLLNQYLISYHSTAIEGGTLTLLETEIFLEKGLSASGKSFEHHLMVKDYFEALQFILQQAELKRPIDTAFIQEINAHVLKNTGGVHNAMAGSFDSSKGDIRLLNVRAGVGGESYLNFDKVPQYLNKMCFELNSKINTVSTLKEINELAFAAHFQCVSIHPFVDGNGRTSRLLMNYIQAYHKKPLSIVFNEDRNPYIQSLTSAREQKSIEPFNTFMEAQHLKFLKSEIKKLTPKPKKLKIDKTQGMSFIF